MGNLINDYYCGIHGDRLELVAGKYSLYLRCPRFESCNRSSEEKSCQNRLSWKEAKILNETLFETGKRYRIGMIEILGGPVVDNIMKIFVINRRTCKLKNTIRYLNDSMALRRKRFGHPQKILKRWKKILIDGFYLHVICMRAGLQRQQNKNIAKKIFRNLFIVTCSL